jgi:multiple sugar transport system ATP-binding protein
MQRFGMARNAEPKASKSRRACDAGGARTAISCARVAVWAGWKSSPGQSGPAQIGQYVLVVDAHFGVPRLAKIYDALDPDRSDLDAYVKFPKAEINTKVREAAQLLGLTEYLNSKPGQLSGGQRQRVAMGRAIVREPSVFLMDEPLSNLDAKLRVQMRAEISRIQRRVGVATLYVTHDQTEAMTMGDRVAVLHMGRLQQCDSPQALYEHPDNLFVAAFIGSPAMNLYEAVISTDATEVKVGSQTLNLSQALLNSRPALKGYKDRKVVIGIRPEHLTDAALAPPTAPGTTLGADVELIEALGNELQVHFLIDATRVRSEEAQAATETRELEGLQTLQTGGVKAAGVARVSPRSELKAGSRATFAVDTERLHFFDYENGAAIWA